MKCLTTREFYRRKYLACAVSFRHLIGSLRRNAMVHVCAATFRDSFFVSLVVNSHIDKIRDSTHIGDIMAVPSDLPRSWAAFLFDEVL